MQTQTSQEVPLYSVLVANYNRGSYIRESIESVLNQTYRNLELIIVDDGSTDDSVKIIREMAASDSRIRVFETPSNEGCGSAMRRCASMAQGEYMGYLGSDDTLDSRAVEIVVKEHMKDPDWSLVYTTHYVCNERMVRQRLAYGAMEIPQTESYLTFGTGITSFASITVRQYHRTEGINGGFKRAVDQDIYYKLEEVGKVHFVNQPVYNYRVNPQGISTGSNISKARYWFVRAKENAYYRRLQNPTAKNINEKELRAWWSVLYVSKANESFRRREYGKGLCWLSQSVKKSLFDRFMVLKFKSLFMSSPMHNAFLKIKNSWIKQF